MTMTKMTTRLSDEKKSEKKQKNPGKIRRPQWKFRTFATDLDEAAEAGIKKKNCED